MRFLPDWPASEEACVARAARLHLQVLLLRSWLDHSVQRRSPPSPIGALIGDAEVFEADAMLLQQLQDEK